MKEIIIMDDGVTNDELVAELDSIPSTERFTLQPYGAHDEVLLDGQFNRRELLALALWLERKDKATKKGLPI